MAWNERGRGDAAERMSDLLDLPVTTLQGEPTTLGALTDGEAALVVNVASRCGLTPQYATLEALHGEYADRGFTVIGVPCNQFGGQEPGTADEIAEFCSATYGVTFPMTGKVDVNGPDAHPLFRQLTEVPDAAGRGGRGPVELREVARRARRRRRGPFPPEDGARRPRGAHGGRGPAPPGDLPPSVERMTADLHFYFDPVCPFAWMTSKWVRQVAAQRDYDVDWRFISLRHAQRPRRLRRALPARVRGRAHRRAAAAPGGRTRPRDARPATAVGPLYAALGQHIFETRARSTG